MSDIASIRLSEEEKNEMQTYGFKNPSQYIRWKMGKISEDDLHSLPDPSLLGLNNLPAQQSIPFDDKRNVNDAVTIAKLEKDLEKYRTLYDGLKDKNSEDLGSFDNAVKDEVDRIIREKKYNETELEKKKIELDLKAIQEEKKKLEDQYKQLEANSKMWDKMKDILPVAQPIIAGVAKGIVNAKSGGGFNGFLEGLAGVMAGPSDAISQEDEKALTIGKEVVGRFTELELQGVLHIIILLSEHKNIINSVPELIKRLLKMQTVADSHIQTQFVNDSPGQQDLSGSEAEEEEEGLDEEEEDSDDGHIGGRATY